MTSFTDADLIKIERAVMVSGMAVSMVDMGIISTAIEATALAKEIAGAAQKYPTNSIIQAAFSDDAIKQMKADNFKVQAEELKPDVAIDTAIAAINDAVTELEPKATPEEIQEFKTFIYSAAEQVATAAGSGLFGTGAKVSEKEASALAKLKIALGL